MPKQDTRYTTKQEIAFLKKLGTYRLEPGQAPGDPLKERVKRKALLAGYIQAAENRVVWGELDKKILEAANRMLKELD